MKTFAAGTASDMDAITSGYGGGIDGAGMTISQCGLEPYPSLFDAVGDYPIFPATGSRVYAADHAFQVALDPGQSIQVNMACRQDPFSIPSEVGFTGCLIRIR